MHRVLLIAPAAGYRTRDFLGAAARLGVEVTVAGDADFPALGADGSTVHISLADTQHATDEIIASDFSRSVDAIVALDDRGVEIAAAASARLGLAHPALDAVTATVDKAELRKRLDVPQPAWRLVGPGADPSHAAAEIGFPVVLKPRRLTASRGVIRADTAADARAARDRIRRIVADACGDPDEPILVEGFVPGREVAVEAIAHAGRIEVLAVFDKPDQSDGPYFEETIYVTPSRLPEEALRRVEALAGRAALGLGLDSGALHVEIRVQPDGTPILVEIAARTIGGACARALRFGLGTPLEELVLREALDLPPTSTRPAHRASGVLMLPTPRGGSLREVRGQDDVLALPGVDGIEITIPVGAEVRPPPESDRYLGFVFAHGGTPDAVEATLRAAGRLVEVVVA
ncbi:MAG: ATP-grasp domain-containing protein [Acidimicrobiia bacterium]|nr:ATP-grasp domain-containing protein [Acidimicrobiia bacterium]